eukprot:Gregarina_sp_Poly_1__8198@NODE_475_length_8096_cov_496_560966_g384_i0_p3_GENE_NODE_475_length_8096_cov_496_560966_g384_i0NODE_475_length_8096_cov_496_560966_g384_i0_p3_ORF_typecomplete_len297_score46_80Acetyltransf_1/PF00583_25/8e12Acetyltransf_10/PF13673_7/2_5e03Acetyltransf_10/PF13673_7/2_1e09Acetyltransf_4/PF13420_7/8_2e07Acetyltransf_7/PF13508_7/0_00046Acetyltransf_3/PF13302_7/0_027PanZ/PF12568_8/2e03PanZ/PF12568_8/0_062GNAT_acetyltr_2/PF13718_6/0_034Acetyltransf_9/PF13527_7/0_11_NODE_475_le
MQQQPTGGSGKSTPPTGGVRMFRNPKLNKDLVGDGNLVIRSFVPEDSSGVQRICFSHFRSLCLAAVRYYIAEHFQDLTILTFFGFWFLRFQHLLLIMIFFNLYLFLKSRFEMEQYIRRDCQDLRDVRGTYLTEDALCHFWVAEVRKKVGQQPPTSPPSTTANGGNTKETSTLVGCIGLVPSRENPSVAKLVRLVVEGSNRRMRIGSRLLLQLEHYARDVGYESVRIYTNTLNPSHMKFVRQHGYTIVQTIRRGLMRGDLVTWHKSLSPVDVDENGDDKDENVVKFKIRSAAQHVMD